MTLSNQLNQRKFDHYQEDNAALTDTTPEFTVSGGVFRAALPTYTDGDAAIFHFDVNGRLMVDTEITLDGSVIINNMGGAAVRGAPIAGNPLQVGFEAANFDGAALPNAVDEGDVTYPKCSLSGVFYTMLIGEDGSKTVHATDDSAQVATPDFLNAGGEYRAAATTYTDGDATILQTDVNGNLKVASVGVSKYENASYAETEDEANDSEFSTSVVYGLDTEAGAGTQLRAVQIAVDNTGLSGTPNVLVSGGIYKDALDTYADNDAVPLHFDVNGRLIVSSDSTDPTVTNATAALAINTTTAHTTAFKLSNVTIHFSAAPTTSENLTVTVDASDGVAYDTVLFSTDPSATAATDVVYIPDKELLFESGDQIVVAFANTDLRTYGLRIVTQAI